MWRFEPHKVTVGQWIVEVDDVLHIHVKTRVGFGGQHLLVTSMIELYLDLRTTRPCPCPFPSPFPKRQKSGNENILNANQTYNLAVPAVDFEEAVGTVIAGADGDAIRFEMNDGSKAGGETGSVGHSMTYT